MLNVYSDEDQIKLGNLMLESVEDILSKQHSIFLCGLKDTDYILIHIYIKDQNSSAFLTGILDDIIESANKVFNNNSKVFIGIGKPVNGLNNIMESYQTSVLASQNGFFKGYNCIVFYEEKTAISFNFDQSIIVEFRKRLKENKEHEAILLIKQLVVEIRQSDTSLIKNIKNIFHDLVLELLRLSNERGIYINDHNNEEFLWETISNLNTLHEIENFITGKIAAYFRCIEEIGSRSKTIIDIISFIQNNLSDENLSIKTISEYSHLSPTYLCAFFKKETRKTLTQFINEARVEKSKEFLKDKRVKLFAVSSKVGFNDPNYYAKVFKKIEGCSPSEYRERYKL